MGIRGPVTDTQRSDLGRIQQSQRHLLGLINGVLDFAKVDAGAVSYLVTDVRLDGVISACEALVAPQALSKRISLAFSECDKELIAHVDHDKLQQIMLNLLSNALKFTEVGGQVSISCASVLQVGSVARVVLQVTDSGCGIAADQLERVFHPFVQIDARLTRTQGGTGLGLAISRDLARGMGGELTVESTLDVGSVFTLVLPAA